MKEERFEEGRMYKNKHNGIIVQCCGKGNSENTFAGTSLLVRDGDCYFKSDELSKSEYSRISTAQIIEEIMLSDGTMSIPIPENCHVDIKENVLTVSRRFIYTKSGRYKATQYKRVDTVNNTYISVTTYPNNNKSNINYGHEYIDEDNIEFTEHSTAEEFNDALEKAKKIHNL